MIVSATCRYAPIQPLNCLTVLGGGEEAKGDITWLVGDHELPSFFQPKRIVEIGQTTILEGLKVNPQFLALQMFASGRGSLKFPSLLIVWGMGL